MQQKKKQKIPIFSQISIVFFQNNRLLMFNSKNKKKNHLHFEILRFISNKKVFGREKKNNQIMVNGIKKLNINI